MVMIRFGSQRIRRMIPDVNTCHCPDCASEQPSLLEANYTLRHISYVIRWVTNKTYFTVCSRCKAVVGKLDVKATEKRLKKHPIPWYDRGGWLAFSAFFALMIGLIFGAEQVDKYHDLDMLRSPHVGDIYAMDFGENNANASCPDCRYGAALVEAIDDKVVRVHVSKRIYNQMSGVTDFAKGDHARVSDEYLSDAYVIPRQNLVGMRQNDQMIHVFR